MARLRHPDFLAALFLLALPLIFFRDTVFGGRVLLPADNLFQWEPWRAYAAQFGVGALQNQLLSDLILENYPWKQFIVQSLRNGELPLWNPYLFAGVPFLAAGQHSALYPLSLLFYLLPVASGFAYVTAINFFLGGIFMYLFLRVVGAGRVGGLVGGVAYAFSGFMVVSVVFPMIVSAAIWLPMLVLVIELALQRAEHGRRPNWLLVVIGAAVVGIQFFAGHVEISLYVLLTAGFYTACRLPVTIRQAGWRPAVVPAVQALAMVGLGGTLAAVQMVPFYELVTQNFRQGSATYEQVVSWAYTWRNAITFLVPDLWGNPSHTSYFDLLTGSQTAAPTNFRGESIQYIMTAGVKNYVEAGAYLGVLPLLLAAVAAVRVRNRYTWPFVALALISLLFTFGTPTYKLLFFLVPGWNQLHTPFRWVFPYTFCVAALAGLGAGWLAQNGERVRAELARRSPWRWFWRLLGWGPLMAGAAGLLALGATYAWRDQAVPLADRLLARSEPLQYGFASGQMLYSYEFRNFAIFGAALLATGVVMVLAVRGATLIPVWRPLAVAVVAAELFVLGSGFNPATEPALLNFVPDAIKFLRSDTELYRVTGYGDDSLHPNTAMIYGIADARGYDSIIPKQYTDYMNLIEPQRLLEHNRVARLSEAAALDSPLLDLLNVKYVVTKQTLDRPHYRLVYDGEMRVYLNEDYLSRAFVVSQAEVLPGPEAVAAALRRPAFDPRRTVLLEQPLPAAVRLPATPPATAAKAAVSAYRANEVVVTVDSPANGLLVLADSYFPGWKADVDGESVEILRADANFRAVPVPAGQHEVVFKYRPNSLIAGGFTTLVGGAALLLVLVFALWTRFYREEEGRPAVQRVAKNSLTPMAATLATKTVDFAFAMLMLRILGPEGVGK
ncbi:MAG: YfhO family protein, partial [Chloroflexota bacterium]